MYIFKKLNCISNNIKNQFLSLICSSIHAAENLFTAFKQMHMHTLKQIFSDGINGCC